MTTPDEARRLADEFEAAQNAATDGPWHVQDYTINPVGPGVASDAAETFIVQPGSTIEPDAAFICLARNTPLAAACRDLAGEVERLSRQLRQCCVAVSGCTTGIDETDQKAIGEAFAVDLENAGEYVSDKAAEYECAVAQAEAEVERLRGVVRELRASDRIRHQWDCDEWGGVFDGKAHDAATNALIHGDNAGEK